MIRSYAYFKHLLESFSVPAEVQTRSDLFRFVEEYLNQAGVEVVREGNALWEADFPGYVAAGLRHGVYQYFRLASDWCLFVDADGHNEKQAVREADFLVYKSGERENNWTQNLDEAIALYRKLTTKFSATDLNKIVRDFVSATDAEETFGPSWENVVKAPGSCSMVANELADHLDRKRIKNEVLTIDLKPEFYGVDDDGSTIKNHTAVVVGEYVLDLTSEQFGSKYRGRFVWPKNDWLKEFSL